MYNIHKVCNILEEHGMYEDTINIIFSYLSHNDMLYDESKEQLYEIMYCVIFDTHLEIETMYLCYPCAYGSRSPIPIEHFKTKTHRHRIDSAPIAHFHEVRQKFNRIVQNKKEFRVYDLGIGRFDRIKMIDYEKISVRDQFK